jgi:hypothetical protein
MALRVKIKKDKIYLHVGDKSRSEDFTNLMIKMIFHKDSILAKALLKDNLLEIQRILEPYDKIIFSMDNSIINSNLNEFGLKELFSKYEIKIMRQLPDEIVAKIIGYNAPGLGKFISKEQFRRNENENLTVDEIVNLDLVKQFYNEIPHDNLCDIAAKYGKIETLQWLRTRYPPCPWGTKTCVTAVKYRHIETLKWLKLQKCPWNIKICAIEAAKTGQIEILEWLISQKQPFPRNKKICEAAAKTGQIKTLIWLKSKGFPFYEVVCNAAAENGQVETLMWLRSQDPPCPWNINICTYAASKGGHIETLSWLKSQGCNFDENTCNFAALNGHIETLIWLRSQDSPCPWGTNTCNRAAKNGHIETLMWLRSQNPPCPWNAETCANAAMNGHIETLMWLRSQNPPCPWDAETCANKNN